MEPRDLRGSGTVVTGADSGTGRAAEKTARDCRGELAKTKKVFRKGQKPELVAAAIVKAVQKDRSVVPVGFESSLGFYASRLLPTRVGDRMARLGDL